MQNENLTLVSWQVSGIIRFLPLLLQVVDGYRDGNTALGIKPKKYSSKDILTLINFFTKFDGLRMIEFLDGKFLVTLDYKGKPLCRTIKEYRLIRNEYLDKQKEKL